MKTTWVNVSNNWYKYKYTLYTTGQKIGTHVNRFFKVWKDVKKYFISVSILEFWLRSSIKKTKLKIQGKTEFVVTQFDENIVYS